MKQLPLSRKRSGELLPKQILLYYGDEGFLIQQKIDVLKQSIANASLNVEQIDGSRASLENVVSALQTYPLLSGEKLVIIKDIDLKGMDWDHLVPSLKMIAKGTQVVFYASGVSKKSKLVKFIDDVGEVYEFRTYAEWEGPQVVAWIKRWVDSFGKKINNKAAEELQSVCGNSLRKLSSEIEKLIAYIGERKNIEMEDIQSLASPGETNVFALSNALANKNLKQSLSAFRVLYKNKIEPFRLLSLLANQYRIMLFSKGLPPFEKNAQRIAPRVGASPYYVKKCLARSQHFSEEELRNNLELILETDLKLKTGEQPLAVLDLMLASLCGQ